jgi:5,10-methylenetetrahydromethanopterin reductase
VWFFPDASSDVIVDAIVEAERVGLDEIWLGDEGPARDPFALLAAGARLTQRIKLGIGVTNPYLRHPAVTAASALTVDELSQGRMVLGIGPGGGIALGPAQVVRKKPLAASRRAVRIMRAVARGEATEGYSPPRHGFTGVDLPIYVGARGEQFNRFASECADGVFLGGVPRQRLGPTVAWARSVRDIDVGVYVSALFEVARLEAVRPRMIYAVLDAPEVTRNALGLTREEAQNAADALSVGDAEPARRLIDDGRLAELMVWGTPTEVGQAIAARTKDLHVTSVGCALLTDDPIGALPAAAEALRLAREELS